MWRELDDVNDVVSTQILYQPMMSLMKDVSFRMEKRFPRNRLWLSILKEKRYRRPPENMDAILRANLRWWVLLSTLEIAEFKGSNVLSHTDKN